MAKNKNLHIRRTRRYSERLYVGLVLAGVVFERRVYFARGDQWFWSYPYKTATITDGPCKTRGEAVQRAKKYLEGRWATDHDE